MNLPNRDNTAFPLEWPTDACRQAFNSEDSIQQKPESISGKYSSRSTSDLPTTGTSLSALTAAK
jgi:hypothetical protein